MIDDGVKQRGLAYAEYLSGLSPEECGRINERTRKQNEEKHKAFHEKFQMGQCLVCGYSLSAFDPAKPCPHWLLKPDGFGKEHFELITRTYSLIGIEHYLRWVANEEAFAKNINDFSDEGSGKLLELTIRYKNLQWSFSCSASDLSGHDGGGEHSKRPHWHFQMYVDDKPFIRYNDFHPAFSEHDIGLLEHMRNNPGKVRRLSRVAPAWATCFTNRPLNRSLPWVRSARTDDEANAASMEFSTVLIAEPGKTIAGEDIYNLIQAAKAENVNITSKIRGLQGANITTTASPGPGVVAQAVRRGRNRKRSNQLLQKDREWRERLKRQSPPD